MPVTTSRLSIQDVALATAVLATVPYLTLKLLWLGGSTVGVTSSAGLAELHSTRYVAGNTITVLLMLVAAAFAVVLTRAWADRIPAGLVFLLGAGATGLLAPILLGMPIGLALQAALGVEAKSADDAGLAPWVFGIVYSGFGVLGAAMAVLVATHVLRRWGHLISQPPERPSRWATVAGAVGLLPFAAAMTYWGISGPGKSGPSGMDLPAQRTVLVVTGLLAAAAYVVPIVSDHSQRWPRTAWLITWTGSCVAALQGPALVLLAQGGKIQPAVATVAAVATLGACAYGLGVLKGRLKRAATSARSCASVH
jgi:hypothetical protein